MELAVDNIEVQAARLVEATAIFWVERVLLILAFVCNFDQLLLIWHSDGNNYTLENNIMAQFWVIGLLFSNAAHFFIFLRRLILIPGYKPSFITCLFTDPHPCFRMKIQEVFCFWADRAVMIISVLPYLDDSFAYFGPVGLIAQLLLAIIINVFCDLDFTTLEVAVKTNEVGKMEAKIDTSSNDGDEEEEEEEEASMELERYKLEVQDQKEHLMMASMELERYKLEVPEKEHLMMASMELERCEWEQEKEHLMAKLQVADESLTVYRENQRLHELEREEWENHEAALSKLTAQAHQAISDAITLKKKLHNLDNDYDDDDEVNFKEVDDDDQMQSPDHDGSCSSYYFHPNSCQACSQFLQHHYYTS